MYGRPRTARSVIHNAHKSFPILYFFILLLRINPVAKRAIDHAAKNGKVCSKAIMKVQ